MEAWQLEAWHWIVVGLVLCVAEVLVPATVLLWTGIAALIVGGIVAIWSGLGWQTQGILFAVLAAVSVAIGLSLRRHFAKAQHPTGINRGTFRFIGQRGALHTAIVNGRGEIKLGDTIWAATGPELPAGTSVEVVASDGTTLTVALPAAKPAAAGAARR